MTTSTRQYRLSAGQKGILAALGEHARECIQSARGYFAGRENEHRRAMYAQWCLDQWANPSDAELELLERAEAGGARPTVNRYASAPTIPDDVLSRWANAGIITRATGQTRSPVYRPTDPDLLR